MSCSNAAAHQRAVTFKIYCFAAADNLQALNRNVLLVIKANANEVKCHESGKGSGVYKFIINK